MQDTVEHTYRSRSTKASMRAHFLRSWDVSIFPCRSMHRHVFSIDDERSGNICQITIGKWFQLLLYDPIDDQITLLSYRLMNPSAILYLPWGRVVLSKAPGESGISNGSHSIQ